MASPVVSAPRMSLTPALRGRRPSVLVVDDEPGILELASAYLRRGGFVPRMAANGTRALEVIEAQPPDLLVLDLMLPDLSGEEVCAEVRRRGSALPILMLTAKSAEEDRLRGLALGADDYLVKPFSPRELVARVRAILRRAGESGAPAADVILLDDGRVELDLAGREASHEGARIPMTPSEFELLAILASRPGRAFSRAELLHALRGPALESDERTIDVHVMRLRRKLEETGRGLGGMIATVYGVGYRVNTRPR